MEEEEPKPFVLTMPERYVPPEVETKLDVQEDSESEFSEKVNKYLTEIKGSKTV